MLLAAKENNFLRRPHLSTHLRRRFYRRPLLSTGECSMIGAESNVSLTGGAVSPCTRSWLDAQTTDIPPLLVAFWRLLVCRNYGSRRLTTLSLRSPTLSMRRLSYLDLLAAPALPVLSSLFDHSLLSALFTLNQHLYGTKEGHYRRADHSR